MAGSAWAPAIFAATTSPVNDGCKVLVADDNRDAADSLATLLRMASYDVHVAHDGPRALELGARELPEIVILDVGMPGTSGY